MIYGICREIFYEFIVDKIKFIFSCTKVAIIHRLYVIIAVYLINLNKNLIKMITWSDLKITGHVVKLNCHLIQDSHLGTTNHPTASHDTGLTKTRREESRSDKKRHEVSRSVKILFLLF